MLKPCPTGKAALSGTKAVLSAVPLIPVGKDKPLNENETVSWLEFFRVVLLIFGVCLL